MEENIEEKIHSLESILGELDAFDVLSKSGFVSAYIYTDFFDDIKGNREKYKYASKFINAFYMTHKCNGHLKLDYKNYEKICSLIDDIHFNYIRNSYDDNYNINSIRTSKDVTTEVLRTFKTLQMNTLFEYQADVIYKRYGIDFNNILDDIHKFYQTLFVTKAYIKDNPLKDVIDKFDNYFDTENLKYSGQVSKSVISTIACDVGAISSNLFSYENPLFTFDVGRKCLFDFNGEYYVFDEDIFFSRICKCIERSCSHYKKEWNENLKIWSEELPFLFLKNYLKDGVGYINNYYYPNGKNNRKENDIIFIYKNNLFVIEIKGEKVNPDPLSFNKLEIEKSYVNQIEKGIEQTNCFIKNMKEKGSVEIYSENKELKATLINTYENIIPIVILCEEMSSFLPDYIIHNHNDDISPVTLNFYDFLVVLDYLSNPFFIVDYFVERTKISNKKSSINDELFYLGVYTKETVHLSEYINENEILKRNGIENEEIGSFFFDSQGYYNDIELFYSNCDIEKPAFKNLLPFVISMLNTDFSKISDTVFDGVYKFFKGLPWSTHENIVNKYLTGKTEVIMSLKELGFGFYLKGRKYLNQREYYAFLLQYFNKYDDIKYVIVAIENKDSFSYECVFRNSVIFLDKEVIEESKHHILGWKQTKQEL